MARSSIPDRPPAPTATGDAIAALGVENPLPLVAPAAPARPVSAIRASLPNRIRAHVSRPAMSARQRWLVSTEIYAQDMRNLPAFETDAQTVLMRKIMVSLESKHANPMPDELVETFKEWRTNAEAMLSGCNTANKMLLLDLIAATSKHYLVTPPERIIEGLQLSTLLETMTSTPHPPPTQKSLIRIIKAYCEQTDVSVPDRVGILLKLASAGPALHAAPINDLRTSQDVQGYAYKLFKHQLQRLPVPQRAQVALAWAQQNHHWYPKLRTLSGQHWKNIGYAAGTLAVAGAASGGIATAVVLGTSGAVGAGVLLGSVAAKSLATGSTLGAASGIAHSVRSHILRRRGIDPLQCEVRGGTTLTGGMSGAALGILGLILGTPGKPDGSAALDATNSNIPATYDTVFDESGLPVDNTAVQHFGDQSTTAAGDAALSVATGFGAIGTGAVVGAVTSYLSSKIVGKATTAILDAGGARGVLKKLRKNPVTSIQFAVQRTAADVFNVKPDNSSEPDRDIARDVIALQNYWLPWIDTALTYPPRRQAKILSNLLETFDVRNYHPDDRNDVNDAVHVARTHVTLMLAGYHAAADPRS